MGTERRPHNPEERLSSLAARYHLPPERLATLRLLLQSLVDDPLAPTAVRDPAKAIDDHLADSLVALELEQVRSARLIADIGAGAGLPGLPLALALPQASVTLVESAIRKCAFLERARTACGISNASVVHARVETWEEGRGAFDLVTARAVAPLAVVVEYAAPLMKVGGVLVAWRGKRDAAAEILAARAAEEVGLEGSEIRPVRPYPEAAHRNLHLMLKVMQTPPRFPRRPGMALKHPLGAR